jgi:hypothetical protein
LIGLTHHKIRILGMPVQQNNDELTLENLMGNYMSQLTPEMKQIITSALQKVRQTKEQKQCALPPK